MRKLAAMEVLNAIGATEAHRLARLGYDAISPFEGDPRIRDLWDVATLLEEVER